MKKLIYFIILSLNSYFINAQCDNLIQSEYDKFDKKTTYKSTFYLQNSRNTLEFNFSLNSRSTYSYLFVTLYGLIDLDASYSNKNNGWVYPGSNAYIQFLFENGSTRKLENSPENGDKFFSTGFWKNNFDRLSEYRLKTLEMLKTEKVESIRYRASGMNYDFDLNNQEKIELNRIFNCIYNNW